MSWFRSKENTGISDGAKDRVFEHLQKSETVYRAAGLNVEFRKIIDDTTLQDLYDLSKDTLTTAQLIKILFHEQYSTRIANLNIPNFVGEAISQVSFEGNVEDHPAVIEAKDFTDAARNFCDETVTMSERKEISTSPEVGKFVSSKLMNIMSNYHVFEMRVIAEVQNRETYPNNS